MESQKYSLNSDFDIELHKENFTNYLEVIILPNSVEKEVILNLSFSIGLE